MRLSPPRLPGRQRVSKKRDVGAKFRIASTQVVPQLHDAMILKSCCAANTDLNPCRTIGCGSAITSRMQRVDVTWSANATDMGLTSLALRGAFLQGKVSEVPSACF